MVELFLTPPSARQERPVNVSDDRCAWRILDERGFFCDDTLWPAGSVLYYDDEPNDQMEPLNDMARNAMRVYLTKLDELARQVAEKNGKNFVSRIRNIEEAINDLREDKMKVQLVQGGEGTPIMGAKRKVARAQKVGAPEVAETTRGRKSTKATAL